MVTCIRRKKIRGMSTIEILIALTILIVLMAGINAVLVTKARLTQMHKDTIAANALAEKSINSIKEQADDINFYLNLNNQKNIPLDSSPFSLKDINKAYRDKFVGELTVQSGEARTTKDTNPGNNVVIFLDKKPTSVGISPGLSVTIYNSETRYMETVFVDKVNDSSKHINIDSSSPEKGRYGLSNNFPAGSIVIGSDKAVKVEIYYASSKNPFVKSESQSKPLASYTTILSFPYWNRQ